MMMVMTQRMVTYGSEAERVLRELLSTYFIQESLALERIDESRLLGLSYKEYRKQRKEAKAYWRESKRGLNAAIRAEIKKNNQERKKGQ